MIHRMKSKISATPIKESKIEELEPKTFSYKLIGRNVSSIMQNYKTNKTSQASAFTEYLEAQFTPQITQNLIDLNTKQIMGIQEEDVEKSSVISQEQLIGSKRQGSAEPGKTSAPSRVGSQKSKKSGEAMSFDQIEQALEDAERTSQKFQEVDPKLLYELKSVNKKFFTQNQLDKVWIINARNEMLLRQRQLEKEVRQTYAQNDLEIRDLPSMDIFKTTGSTLEERVKNCNRNLTALEEAVTDEIQDIQDKMSKRIKPSKQMSKFADKMRWSGAQRHQIELMKQLQATTRALSKKEIIQIFKENKDAYFRELQRRGWKMHGQGGDVDLDQAYQFQEDYLKMLITFVHARQEDLLLFYLGQNQKVNSNPSSYRESRESSLEQQNGQNYEKQEIKLPQIQRNKNLAISQDPYFTSVPELKLNKDLQEKIQIVKEQFVQLDRDQIEEILEGFETGEISMDDIESLPQLKEGTIVMLKSAIDKGIRQGQTQIQSLRNFLENQLRRSSKIDLSDKPDIAWLAMLRNQKPTAKEKKEEQIQQNQEIFEYIEEFNRDQDSRNNQFLGTFSIFSTQRGSSTTKLRSSQKQTSSKNDIGSSSIVPIDEGRARASSVLSMQSQMQSNSRPPSGTMGRTVDKLKSTMSQANDTGKIPKLQTSFLKQRPGDGQKHVSKMSEALINKYKESQKKSNIYFRETEQVKTKTNPKFALFQELLKQNEIDLPILNMIDDNVFAIRNYLLYPNHCRALRQVILSFKGKNMRPFNTIILERNQIKDKDLSEIIEGLGAFTYIEKIQIMQNETRDLSVAKLGQILDREPPYQLRKLVLSECWMPKQTTAKLLDQLIEKSHLNELTLSKFKIGPQVAKKIIQLLASKGELTKFDMSWSDLSATQFKTYKFFEGLAENRTLNDLNVSWNAIVEQLPGPTNESHPKKKEKLEEEWTEVANDISRLMKYNRKLIHLNLSSCGITTPMFEIISASLRKSMTLLSIHLCNNPFIKEIDLIEVIKQTKAKPIDKDFQVPRIEGLAGILKPKNRQELFLLDKIKDQKSQFIHDTSVPDPFFNQQFIFQRYLGHKADVPLSGQWELLTDHQNHTQASDDMKFKDQNQLQELKDDTVAFRNKKECWYCNQHKYTLIFWSQRIQQCVQEEDRKLQIHNIDNFATKLVEGYRGKNQPFVLKPITTNVNSTLDANSELDKSKVPSVSEQFHNLTINNASNREGSDNIKVKVQQFKNKIDQQTTDQLNVGNKESEKLAAGLHNRNFKSPTHQQVTSESFDVHVKEAVIEDKKAEQSAESEEPPMIYLQQNDWKPKQMVSLLDFMKAIDQVGLKYPNFLNILKRKQLCPADVKEYSDLNKRQKQSYRKEELDHLNAYKLRWDKIIHKNLRYQAPHILNGHLVMDSLERGEEVYVLPCWMSAGKHCFMISHQDDYDPGDAVCTLQTAVVGLRREKVPSFAKVGRKRVVVQQFEKENSVFQQWSDVGSVLDMHDFFKWKIYKFVKSEEEQDDIKQFFRENEAVFKDLYTDLQSKSYQYPGISLIAFSNFCKEIDIIDKQFTISAADTLFISANFNENKAESSGNTTGELLRYEFFEIVVRIVQKKYIQTGLLKTYGEALEYFLTEQLKDYPFKRWTKWREEHLWTVECDDILGTNAKELEQLFQLVVSWYQEPAMKKKKVKRAHKEEAIHLFTLMSAPDGSRITDLLARKCYALSKMTIVNEEMEIEKYNWMTFIEFIDLVAKVAEFRYQNTEIAAEPLSDRLKYVLDSLFEIIKCSRAEVEKKAVDLSESDEDY